MRAKLKVLKMLLKRAKEVWPVLLLVIVALSQHYLTRGHLFSPWKGGGFGMFSSIDSPQNRKVLVYLIKNDKENQKKRLPRKIYYELEKRLRTFPSESRVNNFIKKLHTRLKENKKTKQLLRDFSIIRIEVWKIGLQDKEISSR